MRVLVTGGTGFVGRRLVARLAGRGDDVVVLSRDPGKVEAGLRAGRILAWDPMAGPPRPDALNGVEAAVNLLGESIAGGRWTEEKKRRIRDSRLLGTRNLVAGLAACSPQPRVLVSGSAIGWYGPRGDEELDESSSRGEGFLADLARDWEAETERASAAGIRVVLLRIGVVLGREGGALKSMLPPFRVGLGGPGGTGRQWMSWIHVDDLCGLILHALDTAALEGPVNAAAPEPVRNREFARLLGATLRRPALLPAPSFALRLLFGEMADAVLLTGQRVLPGRARGTGFRFGYPRLDEALAQILGREKAAT